MSFITLFMKPNYYLKNRSIKLRIGLTSAGKAKKIERMSSKINFRLNKKSQILRIILRNKESRMKLPKEKRLRK